MAYIETIDAVNFYNEYYGHKMTDLAKLIFNLNKVNPEKNIVYLAGDSSLDNKFWLKSDYFQDAVNGYEKILYPANMLPDVSYHLNSYLKDSNYFVINAAVEESTIAVREKELLAHDHFINFNITNSDILIVSVGGNDIALKPSVATIFNAAKIVYMNNLENIKKGPDVAWGLNHFIELFKDGVEKYILKLIGSIRPKKIIVCMIYYPDEKVTGSWADKTLAPLGYNSDPMKLQEAINQIFIHATSKINIKGSEVIPFPMYKILNGKDTNDYVARVEPSNEGGRKLAEAFSKVILS